MSHLFPTYARWEVEPDFAEGSIMTGKDGKKYLDFTSGIGVCNLGHRPEVVQTAITNQLNQFWHVSNLFTQEQQETAAKKLAAAAELDFVFFSNSGAEANEAAIKLARKATGRETIITFNQSFHGRTFATMAATGQDKVKQGFGPMLQTFMYANFNEIETLEQVMDEDIAAVMLEIVQGEGGIHPATQTFLNKVQKLCHQNGSLLIVDEIQTGIGRTGKAFAFQHYQLQPDIITCAKGLGSGMPIGAVVAKKELKDVFGPGSHGSTFGGNPIAIAAAIATMDTIFKESFLNEVQQKSEYIVNKLQELLGDVPEVKGIRHLGLMIGIEVKGNLPFLLKELRDQRLLTLPAGENVLRLLPPLTVSITEIDQAVATIAAAIKALSKTAV
ncbi:acetylornithine transaminase [Cytobacillus purgationiresistens]|uniref:Acetylornithine aminotransferase n=1 Tax=Cytobacillus purgationiresistens TaxID=863449 RepID=A0ABU0AD89_9BACI|nr:acetylornithine transaminase [Cytobacillus purgationiresistens]MDQ0268762.1 acetylornithine aminotransferase [Cytobacillus purgationiresistens]